MGSRAQTTYINAIDTSCPKYPDLYKLRNYLQGRDIRPGRAVVLEIGSGKSHKIERVDFSNARELEAYFARTASSSCKHRLYLLEDLARPFVEAFGAHFWMDPFLFASQENSDHWVASSHDYALPRRLSSSGRSDPMYTLRYYEVVRVPKGEVRMDGLKTESNVKRRVEAGDRYFESKPGAKSDVYVVRRNASFWSRSREDGGWDALILVDPPVGDSILDSDNRLWSWHNVLYGHGYVDFTPWSVKKLSSRGVDSTRGPPRTSTLDDIAWYWSQVAIDEQISSLQNDVTMCAVHMKKIVASNWNMMLEFVWAKLSEFERALGKFEVIEGRGKQQPLEKLADILAGVNLFRRRLLWYLEEVESSLRGMDIKAGEESDEAGRDLLVVHERLRKFKEKVESLTSIVTGVLSVRQADTAQKATKLVSRLTVIALVFIPLSFTAGIFSMGGDFQPGSSHFWVYFAAAVPITLTVLVLAWQLRGKLWI